MRIYRCQDLSLPYEPIKLPRYCWQRECFCWGSNKNNKWVYLNSYQALIKACLAVEWWDIGRLPGKLLRVSCVSCMAVPRASPGSDVARLDRALGSRDMVLHSSRVTWMHGCCFLHLLCAGFAFCGCTIELIVVFDISCGFRHYCLAWEDFHSTVT